MEPILYHWQVSCGPLDSSFIIVCYACSSKRREPSCGKLKDRLFLRTRATLGSAPKGTSVNNDYKNL